MTNLVIVESPAKAKTINKYLGKDYRVIASYGHIRDLPSKNGAVDPNNSFAMTWEIDSRSKKHVSDIVNNAKQSTNIYLATDPDREGEAISWHIYDVLKQKRVGISKKGVYRVVFNEITASAVRKAFAQPRTIDQNLVDAYLARRSLDYLVGFTISPILWRKLPGCRSAGRVQSVALRLICERETEIETFIPKEYWHIDANAHADNSKFLVQLKKLNGSKLEKFSLTNEAQAKQAVADVTPHTYTIISRDTKPYTRKPAPPFMTSTLQQEAARKLGFSASRTMRAAQKLYEGVGDTGLITYMRTDGVTLSQDAIKEAREVIAGEYGQSYVPPSPHIYKTKAKNAQEAHEAIRPTSIKRTPQSLRAKLDGDLLKLYNLIWQRTVASQMAFAKLNRTTIIIESADKQHHWQVTGSIIIFDGFLKVYEEGIDDKKDDVDEKNQTLPDVKVGDCIELKNITPHQHFTQPPPRFSEASLVKKLEELGIGRPSTYASIIQTLKDRNYVEIEQRRFFPQDKGRMVTLFLSKYFEKYVAYDFTAKMEDDLDNISTGSQGWLALIDGFWQHFKGTADSTKDLTITQVLDYLQEQLMPVLFTQQDDGNYDTLCPSCKQGHLHLKLSKFGAFLGCNRYPDCKYTKPLADDDSADHNAGQAMFEPKTLGNDSSNGMEISLRKGPYGFYIQRELTAEEQGKKKSAKPKRAAVPKDLSIEDIDLVIAEKLLSLPRYIGIYDDTEQKAYSGVGPYGPYIRVGQKYISLPKEYDVLTVILDDEVKALIAEKLAEKPKSRRKTTKKK